MMEPSSAVGDIPLLPSSMTSLSQYHDSRLPAVSRYGDRVLLPTLTHIYQSYFIRELVFVSSSILFRMPSMTVLLTQRTIFYQLTCCPPLHPNALNTPMILWEYDLILRASCMHTHTVLGFFQNARSKLVSIQSPATRCSCIPVVCYIIYVASLPNDNTKRSGRYPTRTSSVCVLDIKPFFLGVDIQHN